MLDALLAELARLRGKAQTLAAEIDSLHAWAGRLAQERVTPLPALRAVDTRPETTTSRQRAQPVDVAPDGVAESGTKSETE